MRTVRVSIEVDTDDPTLAVVTVADWLSEGVTMEDRILGFNVVEDHQMVRKPTGGGGGHTPGVGWMCTGCSWRFSYDVDEDRAGLVWLDDSRHRKDRSERHE